MQQRGARTVVTVVLWGLAVQYLLGMWTNLYAQLPGPSGAMMGAMMSALGANPELALHMWLGMALGITGIGALVAVTVSGATRAAVGTAIGLAGIALAGLNGMRFLMFAHSNAASYLMALGFLIAVAGYGYAWHVLASLSARRESSSLL